MQKAFLFNGDQAIQVTCPNIDGALRSKPGGAVTGALATKCIQVAPRAIHLPGNDGTVILYQKPSGEYVEYVTALYGGCPQIIAPTEINMSELELTCDIFRCPRTLRELQAIAGTGAMIDPFIVEPRVFALARAVGMPVKGIAEKLVRQGLVTDLNDKAIFQKVCMDLGIPIPNSIHTLGWTNVMEAVQRIFDRDGQVVLRRARAAGGLGVVMVKATEFNGALEEHLLSHVYPFDAWDTETILVEEMLDIVASPSTLVYADAARFNVRAMSEQVVNGGSFYGSIYPTRQPEDLARQMTEWTAKYAAHFISVGGAGWFNIDWGVTATGDIVAFESNARYTGSVHPKVIAERLRGDGTLGHVWSNDACTVRTGMTFEEAHRAIADLAWNPHTRSGVVITIPPAGETETQLGYVALAERREILDELQSELMRRLTTTP